VINFSCAKYVPISIIGIVNNMAPVITVILAYFFLGEKLKLIEIIFLLLSVGGILTIIIGGFG
jgi:drug/metabolite transporter (DMT)-like permease